MLHAGGGDGAAEHTVSRSLAVADRRFRILRLVVVIGSLAAVAPQAEASPARRLVRRGVIVPPPVVVAPPFFAPPPFVPLLPPPVLLRPAPVVAVPVSPGWPAPVVGPAGRVRGWLVPPPGPVFGFGEVVTVTESPVGPPVAAPSVATPAAASAPRQVATPARPSPPGTLNVEPIPAPLPVPAADEGVVPAAAELEIPDGTQSILVQPSGGPASAPAERR
jgi:hypothetical protein